MYALNSNLRGKCESENMASDKVLCNICTCFLNQNFNETDENMCQRCFEIKDYLGVLIN